MGDKAAKQKLTGAVVKQSDVDVDKHNLDVEWERQARLYKKWADKLAHSKNEMAECKNALDLRAAELSNSIRNNPAKYKLQKVTDAAVEAAVKLSKQHQACVSMLNAAKHKVDLMESMVRAMDHKKAALENLVWLHGQSYFAEPRTHRRGDDPEAGVKKTNREIANRLNRDERRE